MAEVLANYKMKARWETSFPLTVYMTTQGEKIAGLSYNAVAKEEKMHPDS